jgi:ribosomal protein S18 acetylase RimI-like enzyme
MYTCIYLVNTNEQFKKSAEVIRNSFIDVAKEFGITKDNVPTNGAFIKPVNIQAMYKKGINMYGINENSVQIGFVALEKAKESLYYIEKLSVLPEFRHKGYGKALLDYVCNEVKSKSSGTISVALIDENTVLKNWYKAYGFIQIKKKKFSHLPFTVCFMEKEIK